MRISVGSLRPAFCEQGDGKATDVLDVSPADVPTGLTGTLASEREDRA